MKKRIFIFISMLFASQAGLSAESNKCRTLGPMKGMESMPRRINGDYDSIEVALGRIKTFSSKVYYSDGAEDQMLLLIPGESSALTQNFEYFSLTSGSVYANSGAVKDKLQEHGVAPLPQVDKDCSDFLDLINLAREGDQFEVSLDRIEEGTRVYKRTFYSGVTRYYYITNESFLNELEAQGLQTKL